MSKNHPLLHKHSEEDIPLEMKYQLIEYPAFNDIHFIIFPLQLNQ